MPHSVGPERPSQGQSFTLQLFTSDKVSYWQTSLQAVTSTTLVLRDFPPPQEALHSLHLLHSRTPSQTRQGFSLHFLCSESGGQWYPSADLDRIWLPVPHVFVHEDQALHSLTVQAE